MNKIEKEKLRWLKKEIQEILSYVAPEAMFDHFKQKIFPAIDDLIDEEKFKWEDMKSVMSDDDFRNANIAKCSYCNMTLIRGLGSWYTLEKDHLWIGERHFPCEKDK